MLGHCHPCVMHSHTCPLCGLSSQDPPSRGSACAAATLAFSGCLSSCALVRVLPSPQWFSLLLIPLWLHQVLTALRNHFILFVTRPHISQALNAYSPAGIPGILLHAWFTEVGLKPVASRKLDKHSTHWALSPVPPAFQIESNSEAPASSAYPSPCLLSGALAPSYSLSNTWILKS